LANFGVVSDSSGCGLRGQSINMLCNFSCQLAFQVLAEGDTGADVVKPVIAHHAPPQARNHQEMVQRCAFGTERQGQALGGLGPGRTVAGKNNVLVLQ